MSASNKSIVDSAQLRSQLNAMAVQLDRQSTEIAILRAEIEKQKIKTAQYDLIKAKLYCVSTGQKFSINRLLRLLGTLSLPHLFKIVTLAILLAVIWANGFENSAHIVFAQGSGLTLPYHGTTNGPGAAFQINNDGAGASIVGSSTNGNGIWGKSKNGSAGYFEGNVVITGQLTVNGQTFDTVLSQIAALNNQITDLKTKLPETQGPSTQLPSTQAASTQAARTQAARTQLPSISVGPPQVNSATYVGSFPVTVSGFANDSSVQIFLLQDNGTVSNGPLVQTTNGTVSITLALFCRHGEDYSVWAVGSSTGHKTPTTDAPCP